MAKRRTAHLPSTKSATSFVPATSLAASSPNTLGPSTTSVHAGEKPDPTSGAVNVPVHLSTTFLYPEMKGADGKTRTAPYIYSRYDNPSLEAVERKVAALERADSSLLFASGMGAIQAVCAATLQAGDTIAVQRGVYGGTSAYLNNELAAAGVKVHEFDAQATPRLPTGTKLVWMEAITNPLLRVADVTTWAKAAHAAGARLGVDATFATPLLQQPLALGADYAMHSATKFLGGHTDVTAGVVSCRKALREKLWTRRRNLGSTLDPHAAYLLGRGMKTLALRLERQCGNAWSLAQDCEAIAGVKAVHYPGLPSHPDHKIARRLLTGGFGGVVTLDLGSKANAQAFRRKVRIITPAASLGSVESLVSLPVETSHAYATPAKRKAAGITDGLVRISVGIEDVADLAADLRQAVRA